MKKIILRRGLDDSSTNRTQTAKKIFCKSFFSLILLFWSWLFVEHSQTTKFYASVGIEIFLSNRWKFRVYLILCLLLDDFLPFCWSYISGKPKGTLIKYGIIRILFVRATRLRYYFRLKTVFSFRYFAQKVHISHYKSSLPLRWPPPLISSSFNFFLDGSKGDPPLFSIRNLNKIISN